MVGMVDGPGRAGMSKSQTADFNAQPFLGFTENIQWAEVVWTKMLKLMWEVRGESADWSQMMQEMQE